MLEVEPSGQILDQSPDGFPVDPTRTVLAAGEHLGPYRIETRIGAGGMGEVYRARDPRLNRTVAIKISRRVWPVAPNPAIVLSLKRG